VGYDPSRVGAEWAYDGIVGEINVDCKGVEEAVMAVVGMGIFADVGRP
jgi:hypothetical protein